jgi:hypothetical protein
LVPSVQRGIKGKARDLGKLAKTSTAAPIAKPKESQKTCKMWNYCAVGIRRLWSITADEIDHTKYLEIAIL